MDLLRVCLISLLTLSIFFSTASSANPNQPEASDDINDSQQRQSKNTLISDVYYELALFVSSKPKFSAVIKIYFSLKDTNEPLNLAFKYAQINSFSINGHKIYPNYDGQHLTLSQKLLNTGSNTLEIRYSGTLPVQDGGLNHFLDPNDQQVYLYSDFKEDNASQLLPLFKQASLKARYQLSITTPKPWVVVTTMKEANVITKGKVKLWQFPASPKITLDQLPIYAGPFKISLEDAGKIKLRLISKQSLYGSIDTRLWLSYTKMIFNYFNEHFGIPYPYDKYDQIISPSFLKSVVYAGGTRFTETDILLNIAQTEVNKQALTANITTALAKQWLSNIMHNHSSNTGILTKDPLLDSLALYMTDKALTSTSHSPQIWRNLYFNQKNLAYEQDELTTSYHSTGQHPLSDAFRGAAILRQLAHQFGSEKLRLSLKDLWLSSSKKTITWTNFIAQLSSKTQQDLSDWQESWRQASVNQIKVDFSCSNNRVTSFNLLQLPPKHKQASLRKQKVTLGLYIQGRGQLHRNLDVTVTYQGAKTNIKRLVGVRCPDLVYPNDKDWAYVNVKLDEKSINTAKLEISTIDDPSLKSMLWQSLWESVLDGKLPLDQYLGAVFINLPKEQNITVLAQVLNQLSQSKNYLELMQPIHLNYSRRAVKGLAQMSLRKTMFYQDKPQLQQLWFNAYILFSNSNQPLDHLVQLLEGSANINGLILDQNTRWKMIKQINRYDHINSQRLLLVEQKKDTSENGEIASIAALVSRPEASIKRRWLARIHSDEHIKPLILHTVISHLYPKEQKLLSNATSELRLDNLAELDKHKNTHFMQHYVSNLLPTQCDHKSIAILAKAIAQYSPSRTTGTIDSGLSQVSQDGLQRAHRDEVQCVKMKEALLH